MGVVTVSSSRTPLGFGVKFLTRPSSAPRRPCCVAFKTDGSKNQAFVTVQEPTISIPTESVKKQRANSGSKRSKKISKKVKAVATEEASPCALDVDYNEAAAVLESLYKLSPDGIPTSEELGIVERQQRRSRKKVQEEDEGGSTTTSAKGVKVVVIRGGKSRRLTLDKRVALRSEKARKVCVAKLSGRLKSKQKLEHDLDKLVRDYYAASMDVVSFDWKRTKIPPVLPSSEHTWLFKLMQPMKAIFEVKKVLETYLGREPIDAELAASLNMSVSDMRRQIEIGHAARDKLIKHNLRLVLYVVNKYFQDFGNGPKFQDLCQAGVRGLITAIDRFEPKRGFRLSTYGLFWIRHAVTRCITISSFTRVPFGIESIRQVIQREKLKLKFELDRLPTDEEIITRARLSPDRYHDIWRASKQVLSLNSKHTVTQEEIIKGITDVDGVGVDKRRQPAVVRLALDDVLDSLKPKESMVIRQRYGLDGKGDRTLGEIAGNLNISREMVRKHEVKALMKLKHPARVDYLRRHICKG